MHITADQHQLLRFARISYISEARARALHGPQILARDAQARDTQALARPVSDSASELPTRARLFFPLLPKQLILLFQLLKYFSFVCNGKIIIFNFVFLLSI